MLDVRELNFSIEMWGVLFCIAGIVCVLMFTRPEWRRYRNLLAAAFAAELVSASGDAIAGVFRGQPGDLAWAGTHIGNFATFVGGFFLLAVFTVYLRTRIENAGGKRYRGWAIVVQAMTVVMIVLTALGVFYQIGADNLYQRSNLYWVSWAYVILVGVVNFAIIMANRKKLGSKAFGCLLFYTLLPIVAAVIQVHTYGLNLSIAAGTLGLVVVILEMQLHTSRELVERTEELGRSQLEVSESRISVMVSQIQPHFLFNTLDSIHYLCGEDAQRAQQAIEDFSTYLRANLDSLNRTTPIPVETELAHVRTYLDLEKVSMENLLEYEIDIQATGFGVPALSVQTLAENAAKHGLSKRPEGGNIVIRTAEEPECFIVEVVDNGIGFDVQAFEAGEDPGHLGIENTRMRLAAMCGGELLIESEPGHGTTATMRVPKMEVEPA